MTEAKITASDLDVLAVTYSSLAEAPYSIGDRYRDKVGGVLVKEWMFARSGGFVPLDSRGGVEGGEPGDVLGAHTVKVPEGDLGWFQVFGETDRAYMHILRLGDGS